MDTDRFDSLTRTLTDALSRRSVLSGLFVGPLGLLGVWSEEAQAHNPLKKCKNKSGQQKKACLKKAKKHNATHSTAVGPLPISCGSGLTVCANRCVETQSDATHCGGCNIPCLQQAATTCGTTGVCVGGVCQTFGTETLCRAASCPADSSTKTLPAFCDGAGSCPPLTQQSCDPYLCRNNDCPSDCGSDLDCTSDSYCAANSTCQAKRQTGATCAQPQQCSSGFCVDGVCCATTCSNANQVCLAGTGQCCTRSCAGKVCGEDDGCGGLCTSCPPGKQCCETGCFQICP